MKNRISYAIKSVSILLFAIALVTVLMIAVYFLPTDRMFSHAKESKDFFGEQYINSWTPNVTSTKLSYSTDAIMINNAIYSDNETAIYNAMMTPRYNIPQRLPQESLYSVLEQEKADDIRPVRKIVSLIDSTSTSTPDNRIETVYYPRYWHGYLLVLKPMLLFFNISEIKMMSLMIQVLLSFICIYLLYKKTGPGMAVAFITTWIILNPVTMILTMAESTIYIIACIAIAALLLMDHRLSNNRVSYITFAILGVATAFFDFLTYPLLSLGIPLIVAIVIRSKNSEDSTIMYIICNSIYWSFGYVGLWCGKFVACSLLTDYNAIKGAIESIMFRAGLGDIADKYDTSVVLAIKSNIDALINWQTIALILLITFGAVVMHVKDYRRHIPKKEAISICLVGLMPFVWYAVTSNHSVIHSYFTYRELGIV